MTHARHLAAIVWILSATVISSGSGPALAQEECCKVCSKGQPCGDSCISKKKKCHKPRGCACGADETSALSPQLLVAAAPLPASQHIAVIDGDTIELNGNVIRLEGIDAPEIKQVCWDSAGKDYRCGREAKHRLEQLISDNTVTCTPSGTDRYGRTIAYCTAGRIDLNREMVNQGLARAFAKYNDRYLAEESEARSKQAGFWAGTWDAPWDWRTTQLAAYAPTGTCIIKGNISRGERIYFLPFHVLYDHVRVEESKGERWFCTEDEALAAGWRRALR